MLIAKVSVPKRADSVPRTRIARLLGTTGANVIWIGAPPGSGKTTLAAMTVRSMPRNCRTAWLQIDGEDADPTVMLRNLRLAIQVAAGRRKVQLPLADPAQPVDDRTFARRFARQLFTSLGAGGVLVLDNLQELSGSPAEGILASLAEETPVGSRMFLLSHLQPPAPLASLAARRQMLTLDAEDLRLDAVETHALHASLGARGGWMAEQLHALSQGWAAGVVLLANIPAPPESGGDSVADSSVLGAKMLFDYFAGVVVGALPARCLEILRVASLMHAPRAASINKVTQGEDAERWLGHVHSRGLFLERRRTAGGDHSWVMHRLLSAYLRADTKRVLPADDWLALLRAVARSELEEGHIEQAVHLWLSADDRPAAEVALLQKASALIGEGRPKVLISLLDLFGADHIACSPWLSYWHGVALAHVDEHRALGALQTAFGLHAAAGDTLGQLLSAAAICEFTVQHFSQFHDFERWRERMETLYDAGPRFANPQQELRALCGLLAGSLMLETDSSRLASALARCETLLAQEGIDPNLRLSAATLAVTAFDQFPAEHARAMNLILKAEIDARDKGVTELRRATWLAWLSAYHLQAYKFHLQGPDALRACLRSLADLKLIGEMNGFAESRFVHEWLSADLEMHAGDLDGAEARIAIAETHLRPGRPVLAVNYHMTRSHLAMRRGDARQARDLALRGVAIAEHARIPETVISEVRYTAAQVRLPLGEYAESVEDVRRVIAVARPAYVATYQAGLKGIEALARLARGEDASIELAHYFGWMREQDRPFVLQLIPGEVAKLCAEALRLGIEADQARHVARIRKLPAPPGAPDGWPWRIALRTLGGFELTIDGKLWRPSGKPQRKPLELLKALAARNEEAFTGVNALQLAEELWPDLETEDIRANLHTTLHRARKLLSHDDALMHADGQVAFNRETVWCDTAALRACISRLSEAGEPVEAGLARTIATDLRSLARGPFLPGEEAGWAMLARERCTALLVAAVNACGTALESCGLFDDALALYERGLVENPLVESIYRAQMRIHLGRGEQAAALLAYRRCREALSLVLGVQPSADTKALYDLARAT